MTLPLIIFESVPGVAIVLLVVLAACAITYRLTQRSVRWEIEVMRAEFSDRIASALEATEVAKTDAATAQAPKAAPVVEMPKPLAKPVVVPKQAPAPPPPPQQTPEELAHETLVVIAAAVAAFLGKSVRLRSARLVQPMEGNPWAQQGRVFVQASHNLALSQRAHG